MAAWDTYLDEKGEFSVSIKVRIAVRSKARIDF
jgi:hypothetical protein